MKNDFLDEITETPVTVTHNIEFKGDIGPLFAALAKAQHDIGKVPKDRKNPQFKTKDNPEGYAHAHIDGILSVAIPELSKQDLYFGQHPTRTPNGDAMVVTVIGFKNGATMISTSSSPLARTRGPQDLGSAFTYLRRYAAQGVLGLSCVDADDDGNEAQRQHNEDTAPHSKAVAAKAAKLEAVRERRAVDREVINRSDATQNVEAQYTPETHPIAVKMKRAKTIDELTSLTSEVQSKIAKGTDLYAHLRKLYAQTKKSILQREHGGNHA